MSQGEILPGPKSLNFFDEDFRMEVELIYSWLYQKSPFTTRRSYEFILKKFYEVFPGISFKSVSSRHLVEFLQNHKSKSLATQRLYRNCISSLLAFLQKAEFIEKNPSKLIDRINVVEKTEQRVLSREQLQRIIALEENPRNRFILQFLYLSGLRLAEFQNLKLSDFTDREDRWQITVIGKGNKIRSVYVRKFDLSSLSFWDKNSYVTNNKLSSTQIYRIVNQAGRRVGLSKFSPHWLRHCHATHSLEAGAPIHVVQKTLGHSSIETTGKYLSVIDRISSCDWVAEETKISSGRLDV